jgi:predicted lipoprotein with Yx(FWY)xxD motif
MTQGRGSTPRSERSGPRRRRQIATGAMVAALAFGGSVAAATASTTPRAAAQLQSVSSKPYTKILGNAKHFSLYLLSTESGAKLHCTGACVTVWPPFLVKSSVRKVTVGTGVTGKIGFVKRSATTKQVTFNGYPVYRFSGDSAAAQTNGEGVAADGGIWYLVAANTKVVTSTPVKPKAVLTKANATPYAGVLANGAGVSLYVLSAESGGTLHCTGTCLSVWPALTVADLATSASVGVGVAGTVGFIDRAGPTKQVTFNGFPVYRYVGDYGPGGSNGEGVAADGGTWYLASASATTNGTTEVPVMSGGSTTTTTYYSPPV